VVRVRRNQAIREGDPVYVIDPDLCTECIGFFAEPQCVAACPVDCIVQHPEFKEDQEALLAKFRRLHPDREPVHA
jgi:ferredoxin